MSSSLFGMPISGTHTVIGALLGAGIVATGSENLSWFQLGVIVLSWFASPMLAGLLAYILMTNVAAWTMNTLTMSYRARLWGLALITAVCFFIIGNILMNLMNIQDFRQYIPVCSFLFGFIVQRVLIVFKLG